MSGNVQVVNGQGDFFNSLPLKNAKQSDRKPYYSTPSYTYISLTVDERIIRWLAAPDSSGNYREAREAHQAQTGGWLVDGEQFTSWKQTPNSALWIYGARESRWTVFEIMITYYRLDSGKRQNDHMVSFALLIL